MEEVLKTLIDTRNPSYLEAAYYLMEQFNISKEDFLTNEYLKFINIRENFSEDQEPTILEKMKHFFFGNAISIYKETLITANDYIEEFFNRMKGFNYIHFHDISDEELQYFDFLPNTNIVNIGFAHCNFSKLPDPIFKMNLNDLYIRSSNENFILSEEIQNIKTLKTLTVWLPGDHSYIRNLLPNCELYIDAY